ncbi:MAG: esterase-like activity of phytase family protein [Actinomycetota bacterium]
MSNARSTWVRRLGAVLTLALLASLTPLASPASATGYHSYSYARGSYFERVGTFTVFSNLQDGEDPSTETSAEIVAATSDGKTLVYSDSPGERIGFVDITDPSNPQPDGIYALPAGDEPTAVAVYKDWILVGVIDSTSTFTEPVGYLLVLDADTRTMKAEIDLGGQPDSIGVNSRSRYGAVVIENERNEDTDDEGDIANNPQLPGGFLVSIEMKGDPSSWKTTTIELTGLADVAPTDPEPEYVDVNRWGQAVVTLQENNHLAVVDLRRGRVVRDFSAGTTDLTKIDTEEEDPAVIKPVDSLDDVPREPDAVAWISSRRFATANEGDYLGGSRGFSIYDTYRKERFDSGNSFEHLGISVGHYPDNRSGNKGVEPEGVEYGRFGWRDFLFVGSERGNYVGVYNIRWGTPRLHQVLPTGVGPEGLLAIPERNLFVVASEVDSAEDGVRSLINIYEMSAHSAPYPGLTSNRGDTGAPIGWGAISGLASDPHRNRVKYAVHDNAYGETRIYTVRTSNWRGNGTIVDETVINGLLDDTLLDLEGITVDDDRNWWVASEGGNDTPNQLVHIERTTGNVVEIVDLPPEVAANQVRFGFEGVSHLDGKLYVVFQREWNDDAPGTVKIGRYDIATRTWDFSSYGLDAVESPAGGWVGLSDIEHVDGTVFAIVERDNQVGPDKRIARIYTVDLADEVFGSADAPGLTAKSEPLDVLDLLDDRSQSGRWGDKLEGLTIDRRGRIWYATDNDGIDDSTGETLFGRLQTKTKLPTAPEPPEQPEAPAYTLTVFHHNDAESGILPDDDGIGGAAEFAGALAALRPAAEEGDDNGAILVSAGDNFLAGPAFQAGVNDGTSYDAAAQDLFGYDAMTLGNHDFDFGPDVLADYVEAFDTEVFISANLDVSGEPSLDALAKAGRIAASVVVEEDGMKVGIIGATTTDLPFVSSPRNVVVNADVAAAIQAEVDELRKDGVDIVIVSSHLQGLSQDREIIPLITGVDAYVAGGGDELLAAPGDELAPGDEAEGDYPQVVEDGDGIGRPLVVTPGSYTYLGRLALEFNDEGELIGFGGNTNLIKDFTPDPVVKAASSDPVAKAIEEQAANVLATSEVALDGVRANVRTQETNQGNLIADSQLWQAQQLAASFGVDSPQVAIQNGGGIRNDSVIDDGDVTELDTFAMVPFSNLITVVPDVTPEQLKQVMENGYSRIEFTDGRFAQVAGMTVEVDGSGTAQIIDEETGQITTAGSRVVSIALADGTQIVANGAVVSGAPTIDVAITDFLARGGDQYPLPDTFTVLGVSYQQALANYITDSANGGLGGTITAAQYPEGGEGRIIITNPPTAPAE